MKGRAVDFFISYTKADLAWAEWIAWHLEAAGYTTVIQAWDFRPGSNFVLEMDKASKQAEQTVAVLSPSYLDAAYTHPEWASAFALDPKGEKSLLLPVRVLDCELRGLLAQVIYIDLVGLGEDDARSRLLAQVRRGRSKPQLKPVFPGAQTVPKPAFPAVGSDASEPDHAVQEQAQPCSSATPLRASDPGSPKGQSTLDAAVIRKAEQEFVKHMGPIAPRLVRKAATQATTPEELYGLLATRIRDIDERQDFLRHVTGTSDHSNSAEAPAGPLDRSILATACEELAKFLGPIAKKQVDKVARTATTPEDLYQRLAGYLRNEAEKRAFLERFME